jgi:hypothetical protein
MNEDGSIRHLSLEIRQRKDLGLMAALDESPGNPVQVARKAAGKMRLCRILWCEKGYSQSSSLSARALWDFKDEAL